ncbi:MAG TPA: hypothetical protein VGR43_01030 [Dehalococcoidia bacterium]|jgi:hypothetical protein|nr:hypothetical protein [Dehalococcoidia bacterium]
MIGTTALTQRNIITGVIVSALLAVCAVALVVFVSSSSSETAEGGGTTKVAPAVIGEKDATTGIASVTFIDSAVERVGIETSAVKAAEPVREGSSATLSVPYSSILYDTKGQAFVYTVTGPASYLRALITIDYVEGDQAVLSSGPAAGTEIVSLGVAELYGAETGIK